MNQRILLFLFLAPALFIHCRRSQPSDPKPSTNFAADTLPSENLAPAWLAFHVVEQDIKIKKYFSYIDALVARYDTLTPYHLTEHLLVRANPRIIDSLEATDYYRLVAKGRFVYDQRQLTILHRGDTLFIPDSIHAASLRQAMDSTWLDINIPEFRLRIVRAQHDTLYSFPVRVGQHKRRYQAAIDRVADLRTLPGEGRVVKINRDPAWFIDPRTGEKFTTTRRDDGRVTRMPLIPWIEPEIEGRRLGQLIHPTTNPGTLERPASNGCIGCREADAWRIYYHAPVGTRVVVRYDLEKVLPSGDTLRFDDIYQWQEKSR